jgi:hypothetical protein
MFNLFNIVIIDIIIENCVLLLLSNVLWWYGNEYAKEYSNDISSDMIPFLLLIKFKRNIRIVLPSVRVASKDVLCTHRAVVVQNRAVLLLHCIAQSPH